MGHLRSNTEIDEPKTWCNTHKRNPSHEGCQPSLNPLFTGSAMSTIRAIATFANLDEDSRRQAKMAVIGIAISWSIAFLMAYTNSGN